LSVTDRNKRTAPWTSSSSG